MKIQIGLLLITLLMLPCGASGEFYRYVDGSGMTRFTDDFSKVPLDQRTNVKAYREQVSPPAAPRPPSAGSVPETSAQESSETPAVGAQVAKRTHQPGAETPTPVEALRKASAELDAEYEALMRQKAALDQAQADLKSAKDIKAHNSRVLLFNARIDEFEKRRDALHQEVQAHNTRMRSR